MQDRIKLVRDHKGKTVWLEIGSEMWRRPQTKNQIKAVQRLKSKGWKEMEDGIKYEISTPSAIIEVEKKAKRKTKSTKTEDKEEVN